MYQKLYTELRSEFLDWRDHSGTNDWMLRTARKYFDELAGIHALFRAHLITNGNTEEAVEDALKFIQAKKKMEALMEKVDPNVVW